MDLKPLKNSNELSHYGYKEMSPGDGVKRPEEELSTLAADYFHTE